MLQTPRTPVKAWARLDAMIVSTSFGDGPLSPLKVPFNINLTVMMMMMMEEDRRKKLLLRKYR
jgi:hypothetical protein